MILDSSAVVSILSAEDDGPKFARTLESGGPVRMSAASYLETAIVIDRSSVPAGSGRLDQFIRLFEVEIRPVTLAQAKIARQAYRDFGKGSGHPAQLDFGDCFTYALAIDADEPLLFKGTDFGKTDVRVVPVS